MYIWVCGVNIHIRENKLTGEIMGGYRIEILGNRKKATVNIEGVLSIEKYTREEISVCLSGVDFAVFGKDLCMPVMVENNLCIKGYISGTQFSCNKKEGRE